MDKIDPGHIIFYKTARRQQRHRSAGGSGVGRRHRSAGGSGRRAKTQISRLIGASSEDTEQQVDRGVGRRHRLAGWSESSLSISRRFGSSTTTECSAKILIRLRGCASWTEFAGCTLQSCRNCSDPDLTLSGCIRWQADKILGYK